MTLVKQRLEIDAVTTPGRPGQFDVFVNGDAVARRGGNWLTRLFGAGYPDLDGLIARLEKLRAAESPG